ncbi:MAG: hypothetical protein L0Y68_09035 [Candidatus Dadabacteria bacterium]|nr:hypothetical protein [Candidatus Dadabacteria bacterium]
MATFEVILVSVGSLYMLVRGQARGEDLPGAPSMPVISRLSAPRRLIWTSTDA